MSELSDVVGNTGAPPTKPPTPAQIKPGTATVVAYALLEESLDVNLMDDSVWADVWGERGATRLATMVWAYTNQAAFAEDMPEVVSLRRCQGAITAKTLHPYLFAILRAFGHDQFATAFEQVLSTQRERMAEAMLTLEVGEDGMPRVGGDVVEVGADEAPLNRREAEDSEE